MPYTIEPRDRAPSRFFGGRRLVVFALTLCCALFAMSKSRALSAQRPDDLMIFETSASRILTMPRAGTVTTVTTFVAMSPFAALTEGPDDGSAISVYSPPTAVPRLIVNRVDRTSVTTLSSFITIPVQAADDVEMDDAGDLLVLSRLNISSPDGIYRLPYQGATTLSLVTTVPLPTGTEPVGFAEDADTGSWWILDSSTHLHRVGPGGSVFSIARLSLSSIRAGSVAVDPQSGDLLMTAGIRLFRFDPRARVLTTLFSLGVPQGGAEALAIRYDPFTDGYLFTGWQGFGPGMFGVVHEMDAKGTIKRTFSLGSPVRSQRVVSLFGRIFTPLGPPDVGKTYRLQLRLSREAGVAYQAALAFGSWPGIPTPRGRIPLNPDPLFFLSLNGGPLFPGFTGVLDGSGGATLGVAIPNAGVLAGVRVILGAVTFDQLGLRRIVGPYGFTIR